jgi:hypothetical protein
MTTIAWDGTTLAVDSRVSIGPDIFDDRYPKLQRNVGIFHAVAFSGAPDKAEAYIRDILSKVTKPEELWGTDESGDFAVLGITKEGVAWFLGGDNTYTLPTPWAYGSGADFAISAMDHGKTAEESVKYASTRDTLTNSKVHKYSVNKVR